MSWRFGGEVHNSHPRVAAQRGRRALEEGFHAIAQHAGRQALQRHQRNLELAEQQDEIERWEGGHEEDGNHDDVSPFCCVVDIRESVPWEPRLLVQQQAEAHLERLEHEATLLEVSIRHNRRMQDHAEALDFLDQDMENIVEAEPADELREKEDEGTLANPGHIVMPDVSRSLGWIDFCEGLDDALRLTVTEKTNEFCYSGPKLVKVRGGKYSLAQLSAGCNMP
jgi:hypothetical protein